ncbi:hypothetical protein IJI72_03065 [Candidatus Saccharibacteria bacterium]|nr:hypothetical protein [Candidatus Saccharibacteria bacterium]
MTVKKEIEKNDEKNAEKKAYLERKEKLFRFEEGNFEKVVIVKGTGGYWSVFGHSAVILVNKIAPELKIRIALRRDTDFGTKFREGGVTFKNIGFYKAKLMESEYLVLEREMEDFIIYRLKQRVSETEYDLLLRSKEIRKQRLEEMITKAVPMPKLRMKLTEVFGTTYRLYVKHGNVFDREFLLRTLAEDVRKAHKVMLLIGRDEVNLDEGVKKIKQQLELAMCDIGQVAELGIWKVEDSTTVAILITEALVALDSDTKMVKKTTKKS